MLVQVSSLLNHTIFNSYEAQGLDVMEVLFLINTTQTVLDIQDFNDMLTVLIAKYGLRGNNAHLVNRTSVASAHAQEMLLEYHKQIKHENLAAKYRLVSSPFVKIMGESCGDFPCVSAKSNSHQILFDATGM